MLCGDFANRGPVPHGNPRIFEMLRKLGLVAASLFIALPLLIA